MHPRSLASTFAAAMLLAGCADSRLPHEPGDAEIGILRLQTRTVSARVGEPVRMRAQALTVDGEPVADADIRWRTADPSIARIEADGVLVPVSAGETEVVATVGTVEARGSVRTFGDAAVRSVSVDPDPTSVAVGANAFLAATLEYTNGNTVQVRTSLDWKSLDPDIATVAKGRVSGIKAGTTKVVGTFEDKADTVTVTVGAATAAPTLALSPDSASVAVGATVTLVPSLSDDSNVADLGTLSWKSSNGSVATVSPSGVVTGVAAGTVTVTVTGGSTSATAKVVVTTPTSTPTEPAEPAPAPVGGSSVELPRAWVDVRLPSVTGRTLHVRAGQSVQAAVDSARLGDEIVLEAGATFTGTVTLRNKTSGSGWIIIRSSATGSLPAAGTRVTPAHAALMPRLVARNSNERVIMTEPGAHHYRLIGLEVTATAGTTLGYTLVALGSASGSEQTTLASQAHTLVLDRMYIHGTPTLDFQRCVALNSGTTAIVDSWISECHGKGKDSQAIAGWNGTGPYKIVNNFLEGAGENVMFGGADPAIPNALPEDIEIRRNHFYKPPTWKGVWTVKNLLELKIGRRVLIEGNVFENNWADGQAGFAVLFKSVNQSGGAPWSETSDVTMRYNVVRNSSNGLNIAAKPESYSAVPASRFHIAHNVFEKIGTGDYSGGKMMQITEINDLTLVNNTGIASHSFLILVGSDPMQRFVFQNNVFSKTSYGISGNGSGYGTTALDVRAPGWTVTGNVFTGMSSSKYPANNYYPTSESEAGLSASSELLGLSSGSPYYSAGSDGTPLGADTNALGNMIRGVVMN